MKCVLWDIDVNNLALSLMKQTLCNSAFEGRRDVILPAPPFLPSERAREGVRATSVSPVSPDKLVSATSALRSARSLCIHFLPCSPPPPPQFIARDGEAPTRGATPFPILAHTDTRTHRQTVMQNGKKRNGIPLSAVELGSRVPAGAQSRKSLHSGNVS